MQKGKDLEDSGTDTTRRRPGTGPDGPRPVGPGRLAHPSLGPNPPSFDLAAIRAIYSPRVESHAGINSSSATDEQTREGHHPGEERVELVD
jgi:hypothetical protein